TEPVFFCVCSEFPVRILGTLGDELSQPATAVRCSAALSPKSTKFETFGGWSEIRFTSENILNPPASMVVTFTFNRLLPPSPANLRSSSFAPNLPSTSLPSPCNRRPLLRRSKAPSGLKQRICGTGEGRGVLICRAELSQDAPYAAAIGACMLSSLLLSSPYPAADEESDSGMDTTDTRLTVMGIISFVPYFNWLSWVFAWIDTGKRRYAVYALAYLGPYLRYNLSLSPEDSWLPIASIFLGVIHVQLETSIKNGDIQGFQLFNEASKLLSFTKERPDDDIVEDERIPKLGPEP
ncbi:unnamed protein product, partial [Linum tenue]